jgi:membrane fusion protein (multidrug efflux system)
LTNRNGLHIKSRYAGQASHMGEVVMSLRVPPALFGLAALIAIPAAAQTTDAPPAVGVITVTQQPVYNEQSYVGRIESPDIVQLTPRVTGYLEQQNFHDGDQVTKGQLLYVIEQPPYQAAVTQAKAALEQALAQSRNADKTLARDEALLSTPAGLPANVDTSTAAAVSGSAAIDSARAQLQVAQINLGYTTIRAPISGQIGATNITTGNVVSPTSGPLATIVQQDPMYVSFALPVVDALTLRQNTQSTGGIASLDLLINLPDGRTYTQTGHIDFINNQVTENTDTITWRGTIPNPKISPNTRELTDGEFVTVTLRNHTPTQAISIPRQAVITDQLGDYVLKLTPTNVATRQPITMGPQTNTTVQITTGLTQGDRIIITGLNRIHPGLTVTPGT